MPHPEYPKQPPTPEKARTAKQEPRNNTGDLALFTEFRIAQLQKLSQTSSSERQRKEILTEILPKTKEVNEIFDELFKQGIKSLDQALVQIDESINEYSKLLNSGISDDEFDRYKKEQEGYEEARRLLEQHRDTDFFTRADFDTWNKERNARLKAERMQKQEQEEQVRRQETESQIEDVYQKLGVESPSEREKMHEQAIQQVLEDGGINIFGSFSEKTTQGSFHEPQRGAGYQELTSSRLNRAKGELGRSLAQISSLLDQNKINEAVVFERIQESIIEQVIIPGKTKWGGLKKEPDKIEYRQTGRYKTHADFVQGGKSETPVRIVYTAKDVETEGGQKDKYSWRDYSGREGNQMGVEIFVPESTAREIKRLIDSDPIFIRQIVERVMKEKVLKDPNEWKREADPKKGSVRPPYERWDSKPESGQIYVQTEDMTPGFHREAVRKIKK